MKFEYLLPAALELNKLERICVDSKNEKRDLIDRLIQHVVFEPQNNMGSIFCYNSSNFDLDLFFEKKKRELQSLESLPYSTYNVERIPGIWFKSI